METVHAEQLDALWTARGRPRVALMKVDVEGFETEVFSGAAEIIHANCPTIFFEDGSEKRPASDFLRRRFDYCAKLVQTNRWGAWDFVAVPCLWSGARVGPC